MISSSPGLVPGPSPSLRQSGWEARLDPPSPPSSHHGDLGDAGSRRRFRSPPAGGSPDPAPGARAPRDVGARREGPPRGGGEV